MYSHHTITPHTPTKLNEPQVAKPTQEAEAKQEPQERQDVTLGTLQRQFSTIASEVGELARLVRGGAETAVASAVGKADDVRQGTTERAREVEKEASDWIRSRPFQASLVSMGLGALLWSLLKRS